MWPWILFALYCMPGDSYHKWIKCVVQSTDACVTAISVHWCMCGSSLCPLTHVTSVSVHWRMCDICLLMHVWHQSVYWYDACVTSVCPLMPVLHQSLSTDVCVTSVSVHRCVSVTSVSVHWRVSVTSVCPLMCVSDISVCPLTNVWHQSLSADVCVTAISFHWCVLHQSLSIDACVTSISVHWCVCVTSVSVHWCMCYIVSVHWFVSVTSVCPLICVSVTSVSVHWFVCYISLFPLMHVCDISLGPPMRVWHQSSIVISFCSFCMCVCFFNLIHAGSPRPCKSSPAEGVSDDDVVCVDGAPASSGCVARGAGCSAIG